MSNSRQISKWFNLPDGERAGKWLGKGDVRSYRPPDGYKSNAAIIDEHPANGQHLSDSEWWIFLTPETKG